MTTTYYGFIYDRKTRKYPEVLATKERGKPSTDAPTGVVYDDFDEAERGVLIKNIAQNADAD